MFDPILKYLSDHWPKLTAMFCVVLVCVLIAIYMTKKILHWMGRVEEAEKKCDTIDSHIVPKLATISTTLNSLSTNINSLVVYLKSKDGGMDTSLFVSRSPVQLTQLGEDILKDTGGKDFVDNNLSMLLNEMQYQNIKTALDAQNFAPLVVSNISTNELFKPIKDYIFKNPQYKTKNTNGDDVFITLDMNVITNVMGIYLRNKYLEVNPDLAPE
ncbi:hypothetical protein JN11_01735 [Mucilaginibacter frigoritolerans]|uniref:Uncharacterized protein n=1 Tax=Mucilaginibacter frigoritolerans TaxID=652788 RepID=A0A562U753_9SPHI|nr:hypothetical protein [Mucilaginibacter frigoritolerans]TWJ01584.1 hypothetical protein JN11_01735 [Mucilaginibacter frigoritolerans]